MEWQPIETAPKGKRIILYYPEYVYGWQKNTITEMVQVDIWPVGHPRKPTHWLPLPDFPKSVEQ